jgi:hypothetical protein
VNTRPKRAPGQENVSAIRILSPDAVVQAELGLILLGLRHPELRSQLQLHLSQHLFPDQDLAALLEEICANGESSSPSEAAISARLNEQQRGWLSGMMVGSFADDTVKAHSLVKDYLKALDSRQRRREVADLRRAASAANGDRAVAAAQALIVARRRDT